MVIIIVLLINQPIYTNPNFYRTISDNYSQVNSYGCITNPTYINNQYLYNQSYLYNPNYNNNLYNQFIYNNYQNMQMTIIFKIYTKIPH